MGKLQPTATGSLSKTPLTHLLLYCRERQLSGTLCLWRAGSRPQGLGDDQIYMERGLALAAATQEPAMDLRDALTPLSCRTNGVFAFYEARCILPAEGNLTDGVLHPFALLAAALRGPYRDDLVNATLTPLDQQMLQIKPDMALSDFQFTREENELVAYLGNRPATVAQLVARGRPSATVVRRVVYALRVTRCLRTFPASARQHSGTVEVPEAPPLVAERVTMPRRPTPSIPIPNLDARRASMLPTVIGVPAPDDDAAPVQSAEAKTETETVPSAIETAMRAPVPANAPPSPNLLTQLPPPPPTSAESTAEAESLASGKNLQTLSLPPLEAPPNAPKARTSVPVSAVESLRARPPSTPKLPAVRPSSLSQPPSDKREDRAHAAFDAGRRALNQKKYPEAVKRLSKACKLAPGQADYLATLALARFELAGRQTRAARGVVRLLESAIGADPGCERAHHYLGVVLKQIGDAGAAAHHFELAYNLNPNNLEAARELRLHAMRTRSGQSGGIFNRLIQSIAPPRKTGGDKKR